MKNSHGRTWNMVRNTEKCEKREMYTVGPGLWGENCKTWKIRDTCCRSWNMERKLTNEEYVKLTR
jgi:hypothetical protein